MEDLWGQVFFTMLQMVLFAIPALRKSEGLKKILKLALYILLFFSYHPSLIHFAYLKNYWS
jgi:hypothetical protein